jgi:hypothetical protein
MNDLTFSYNTSGWNETIVEFLVNKNEDGWVIFINKERTKYTLNMCESQEDLWYELYKGDDCIKTFDFDRQTIRFLPNLISVYQFINQTFTR